jgi:hypothetical protein
MRTILEPIIYYLIPGKIERLLEYAHNSSNYGLYGLYLGVRNRRNIIYLTGYFGILSCFFKYIFFRYIFGGLLTIEIYSYITYILTYKSYF